MSEKLISADRVLFFIKRDSDLLASCGEEQTVDDVIAIIKTAPAVDAVKVVRCDKCKHLNEINEHKIYAICEKTKYVFSSFEMDTRTHFCGFGERRDENAVD